MPISRYAANSPGLLACDQMNSVIGRLLAITLQRFAHTPHGMRAPASADDPALGFNGQYLEPKGTYLLGNGYRAYNPQLMRFCSPDSYSPFGLGGLNAYAYCKHDPVNRRDPSGHMDENVPLIGLGVLGLLMMGGAGARRLALKKWDTGSVGLGVGGFGATAMAALGLASPDMKTGMLVAAGGFAMAGLGALVLKTKVLPRSKTQKQIMAERGQADSTASNLGRGTKTIDGNVPNGQAPGASATSGAGAAPRNVPSADRRSLTKRLAEEVAEIDMAHSRIALDLNVPGTSAALRADQNAIRNRATNIRGRTKSVST